MSDLDSAVLRNVKISGPRWSGIPEAISDGARLCKVNITRMTIDKGFLGTTVYFDIEGPRFRVEIFRKALIQMVEKYG